MPVHTRFHSICMQAISPPSVSPLWFSVSCIRRPRAPKQILQKLSPRSKSNIVGLLRCKATTAPSWAPRYAWITFLLGLNVPLSPVLSFSNSFKAYHSVVEYNKIGACGARPVEIRRENQYEKQFLSLRHKGYVGIMVEMVSSSGGEVLPPAQWDALAAACEATGLYLVVDEAMTAVRCGSAFACLRPEYTRFRPSFVIYGKGLRICGLAVFPDGVTVRRMGYDLDTLEDAAASFFDRLSTEPAYVRPLLNSWAVIRCAQEEDWPARATSIGEHLRELVQPMTSRTGGLGALLYLKKEHAVRANVIGAAAGPRYIRWIPYLDIGMQNRQTVRVLFGPASGILRQELKTMLSSNTSSCVICGDAGEGETPATICDTCFCPICNVCSSRKRGLVAVFVRRHLENRCLEQELQPVGSGEKRSNVVAEATLVPQKRTRSSTRQNKDSLGSLDMLQK